MAAPSAPSSPENAKQTPPITPRSSRRVLGLHSFFHHLDEAYEKKAEEEKLHHGGILDEESEQRLLGSEPVPFELSESSEDSESVSSETEADLPSTATEATNGKPTSEAKAEHSPVKAQNDDSASSGAHGSPSSSSSLGLEGSATISSRNGSARSNGEQASNEAHTPVRLPLRSISRSQTSIDSPTSPKLANDGASSNRRPSAVGSLTSFWEKLNEKEKNEADRLRVKHTGTQRSQRSSLVGASPASPRTRSDVGVKLTATGSASFSPRTPKYASPAHAPSSPKKSPRPTASTSSSLVDHDHQSHLTSPTLEHSKNQDESPSNASSNPSSENQTSSSHDHQSIQVQTNDDTDTQTKKHSINGDSSSQPHDTVETPLTTTEPNVIAVTSKKRKSGKSTKPKETVADVSSDVDTQSSRDATPIETGRKKRSSSKKKSGSPRVSDADLNPEFSLDPVSEPSSLTDQSPLRSHDQVRDNLADISSQDSATTSSSKSPKASSRKASLAVPESKHDSYTNNDKERAVQSDAEGYPETQKERKKKSKQNAPRANSTSHIPKERVQIRERKESKSPTTGSPASARDRSSSPSLRDFASTSSPDLKSDKVNSKASDSKSSDPKPSKSKITRESSKISAKEGKDAAKDSPKDKTKRKAKRSSSKSSKEGSNPPTASQEAPTAETTLSAPISAPSASPEPAPMKAGRKKKKKTEKKKSSGSGNLSLELVEKATQSITSPATGQIELGKLRAFFSTWDPKAMTHSWEINPQEVEFVELIGEGTSCAVYRGTYRGQVVALKVLKDINTKQLTNFVKEFDIISDFRSPFVVFFFGACIEPIPVMVLGLCPRGSLYDVLKRSDTNLTWATVIKVCISTLRGLDSLHKWKPQIVHRDLKSRNILVEDDWSTKLCDFGESRYNTGTNLDTLCKIRGTYAYIAPEVYFGQSFTTKSDVYAFGVILWEICNHCVRGSYMAPFAEYKTLVYDFQIIVQASRKGMRPIIDPNTPLALSNIIQLCWDHEPDNRPHAHEILRFFEDIASDTSKPVDWLKSKHALHWPPPAGPGKPGVPPRTGGYNEIQS